MQTLNFRAFKKHSNYMFAFLIIQASTANLYWDLLLVMMFVLSLLVICSKFQ
jgi:hypothetical protein